MRSLLISFLLLAGCVPCEARDVLYVVLSHTEDTPQDWCPHCRNFRHEWASNRDFSDTLSAAFECRKVSLAKPDQALFAKMSLKAATVPAFIVERANGRREAPIFGFSTAEDLMMRLGLRGLTAPLPPEPGRKPPQASPLPQAVPEEFIRRVREELRQMDVDLMKLNATNRELAEQLKAAEKRVAELLSQREAQEHEPPQPVPDPLFTPPDKPPPNGQLKPEPSPEVLAGRSGEPQHTGLGAVLLESAKTVLKLKAAGPFGAGVAGAMAVAWLWRKVKGRRSRSRSREALPAYQGNDGRQGDRTEITYLNPPATDDLLLFRKTMEDVSDRYPAARSWVRFFETAFRIKKSGVKHGY